MRHRYVEQFHGHAVPVENLLVVEIRPMELELLQESVFPAWVGKVERFLRSHRHKNLYHGEDAMREDTLVHVTLDLEHRL